MRAAFLLAAVLVSSFVTQLAKAEAVSCRRVDAENIESQIHVYLLADGRFGLEASSVGGRQPYKREAVLVEGSVSAAHRRIPNGRFSGEGVEVVPVVGGYQYADSMNGVQLYFDDADCAQ